MEGLVKGSRVSQAGRVVLAVSGSIAAFKAAALASDMVKAGLDVRVILTAGGARFVSALTFEALTGHAVGREVWDEHPGSSRMGHLELARWADSLVVAPATAGTIARLANGFADDLLGAVALACDAPLVIAPAMETAMLAHAATKANLATLTARGAIVVGPESGRLASGAEGLGRMAEPDAVLRAVLQILKSVKDLEGYRVLVTAGPTYESIDRVRYVGNRSSGKMGYAVASESARRGARVTLVSGPTALPDPARVELVHVESSGEMLDAVLERAGDIDAFIMAAAVADFRPASAVEGKIKRERRLTLDMVPTEDIATEARRAAPNAVHVGFALEADNLIEAARSKLERKGQDLVVANLISSEHNPFGSDANRVVLVTAESAVELPLLSKYEVASRICDELASLLRRTPSERSHRE